MSVGENSEYDIALIAKIFDLHSGKGVNHEEALKLEQEKPVSHDPDQMVVERLKECHPEVDWWSLIKLRRCLVRISSNRGERRFVKEIEQALLNKRHYYGDP